MNVGRTAAGRRRARARRKQRERLGLTPLLRGRDHGDAILVEAEDVGESGASSRWTEGFIQVNAAALHRLRVRASVAPQGDGAAVRLQPGPILGAVPLLAPSTRKVAAGLLIEPRFGWSRVGTVLSDVRFTAAPRVGGLPMVPGSAREVPPWILAGPVLARLRAVVRHLGRSFGTEEGLRRSPRGTVDWGEYARHGVPNGRWDRFRCTWPELRTDPWMSSTLRWTVRRIREDLDRDPDSTAARQLVAVARDIERHLGPGPSARPDIRDLDRRAARVLGEVVRAALEGVSWVAEERGLGGARVLDGVPWSLGADLLWEAWLEGFALELAKRLGGRLEARGHTRRSLRWTGRPRSMGALVPDLGIHTPGRTVWLDAKYKFHLQQLRTRPWSEMPADAREAHRADLHQALAYAALSDAPAVDTALVYPLPGDAPRPLASTAQVPAGRRAVRLLLLGLPFGCRTEAERERALTAVESVLRAAG